MNWGYRIVLAFVAFISFIVTLIVYTSFATSDLVADDYYQQEVNYQQIIEAKKNSFQFKDKLKVVQDNQKLVLVFPKEIDKEVKGVIHFYHPQNKAFDKVYDLDIGGQHNQVFYKQALMKGSYTLKLTWEDAIKSYYLEKPLIIS